MMTNPFACLTLALGLAAITASTTRAEDRPNCADRELVVNKLQSSYGEKRQSIAISVDESLVEVFASEQTGTWTILVTSPGGKTCIANVGKSYMKSDPIERSATSRMEIAFD